MGDARATGGKRRHTPVKVYLFPKRAAGEAPAPALQSRQKVRVRDEEIPTMTDITPLPEPAEGRPGRRTDSGERRRAREASRDGERSGGGRGGRGRRRRTLSDVQTDPGVSTDPGAEAASPARAGRGATSLTRAQIAEMSIFGHQLFETGRVEEARVVFEGLVGVGVEEAFPHTMLGTIYLGAGKPDRAAALFEAALQLDPDDLAARVYRGELRLNEGKLPKALEDLERAVERGEPDDPFVDRAKRLIKVAQDRSRRRRR